MYKIFFIMLLACLSWTAHAQIDKIAGEWKTVDDKTGEVRALVRIYKAPDGLYYGKIVKMFMYADMKCTECEGEDKDKPMLGLMIIRSMKAVGDVLKEGYVLDPESGKKYYGTISYETKTGKLKLRGSLDRGGWLGRNQYWQR